MRAAILSVDNVADVHYLHLWNLASDVAALSTHVVTTGEPTLRQAQHTADQTREVLQAMFELTHVTLELECAPLDTAQPPATSENRR